MTIASDRATLLAQLSKLSEEELRALLSTRQSSPDIDSTPAAVSTNSVPVPASHGPLPNSSVGDLLSAMASSRRQSEINEYFHGDVQSHEATPRGGPSRQANITPEHFTVFRSQSPPPPQCRLAPTKCPAPSPAGLPHTVPGPVSPTNSTRPGRQSVGLSVGTDRSTGVTSRSHDDRHHGNLAHPGQLYIEVWTPAHLGRQSIGLSSIWVPWYAQSVPFRVMAPRHALHRKPTMVASTTRPHHVQWLPPSTSGIRSFTS
jgi:hypothetical protein